MCHRSRICLHSQYNQPMSYTNNMQIKSRYNPYDKYPIIKDVFGESFFLKEVFYDSKFNLQIHSGRPVSSVRGNHAFIVTPEMKAFILSTLDVHIYEFTDRLKKGKVIAFRRLLQNNPFKSYEQWVNSKQKGKPRYISFNDARENPQILTDVLGQRYVLMSARKTDNGLILPMGALESLFFDKKIKNSKTSIITPEIAKILEKTRFSLTEGTKYLPLSLEGISALHQELGYKKTSEVHKERNSIYVKYLDELLHSTAKAFFLSHPELDTPQKIVGDMKLHIGFVLKEAKKSKSLLIAALLEHWKTPNRETSKKVDKVYGRKSPKIRRAFLVLRKAKRI